MVYPSQRCFSNPQEEDGIFRLLSLGFCENLLFSLNSSYVIDLFLESIIATASPSPSPNLTNPFTQWSQAPIAPDVVKNVHNLLIALKAIKNEARNSFESLVQHLLANPLQCLVSEHLNELLLLGANGDDQGTSGGSVENVHDRPK